MKKIIFGVLAAALLSACVNGKGPKGTPVEADSLLARDSVSTLTEGGLDGAIIDGMGTAVFDPFFEAFIDEQGNVKCQFKSFDDPNFSGIFSEECPQGQITVKGTCKATGIKVLIEGSGVDPTLWMIMEDTHAERISLWELSSGSTQTTHHSIQEGIVDFDTEMSQNGDGQGVVGILQDGSKVNLDWEVAVH